MYAGHSARLGEFSSYSIRFKCWDLQTLYVRLVAGRERAGGG